MGLFDDLLEAKLAGDDIRRQKMGIFESVEPDEAMIKEVELTRDAILNFLTSDDLIWTINKFKASVELEEISTEELGAKVDTNVDTNVSTTVTTSGGQAVLVAGTAGATSGPGSGTGTGTGKGTGIGTVTDGLNMRRNGGRHGGELIAIGYAYIGSNAVGNKEVFGVENVPTDNQETEVRLDMDRIPEKIK